jgi:hypothetical protein
VQQELASGVAVAKNLEVYVRNQSGSTIPAGSIVYISGATGNKPLITLAQANNDANSAQTMGFTKTAIANNGFGYVIVRGELENIDTSALTEGVQLYLSPTTAGTWTTTKPSAPQHLVYVGIVVRAHPTQGIILVAIQNGYELNELHDVKITSASNGQVLKYDSSTNLWVNGTDSAGVAWGGITGTLSSQTDLQNALDLKLAATTAASTYQTLAGMSSYLTTSTASTTYALKTNGELKGNFTLDGTAASPNSDGSILIGSLSSGYNYLSLQAGVIQGVTYASGNKSFTLNGLEGLKLFSSGQGVRFPDATTQTTAYPGSSDFLLKADNLSGLANTGTARTNLGLGTMAVETATNYLTTASASSTYFTIANAANKADLASPTFTGTPSLPTGTIGVTQSPGNNTTALATTAFVTAAVPAFATLTDVIGTPSSTTLALNPSLAPWVMANANVRYFGMLGFSSTSGGGITNYGTLRETYATGASQRATYMDALYAFSTYGLKSSTDATKINFSKKHWLFGIYFPSSGNTGTNHYGDANTTTRINLGGRSANAVGALTQKGIGLFKAGGTGSLIYLTVHNGTTLTSVSSGVTNATGQSFKYVIYSDGTGNVTLYLDGVSVATTSAGPIGTTTAGYSIYEEQAETSATFSVRQAMNVTGAGLIIER